MSKRENLVEALGALVLNFSYLETILMYSVWVLIDISDPKIGMITTAGMPFSSLVRIFDALYRHRVINVISEEGKKEELRDLTEILKSRLASLENLIKQINQANEQRNKMIHSAWGTNDESPTDYQRIKFKLKKGIKRIDENTDTEDVKNEADFIMQVAHEVEDFTNVFQSPLFWLSHLKTWDKQWETWADSGDIDRDIKWVNEWVNDSLRNECNQDEFTDFS